VKAISPGQPAHVQKIPPSEPATLDPRCHKYSEHQPSLDTQLLIQQYPLKATVVFFVVLAI
jgi:hypothetical protein